jgi:hypothetical protein
MEVGKKSIIKRTIRHLRPSHIVKTRLTRRVVQKVAEKYGLVYFGYVNHKDDDHKSVRGYTVSKTQIDNHYSVGTIQDYDVTFVQRNDVVLDLNRNEVRCHWLIASIDLKSRRALPNFFVGPQAHSDILRALYSQFHQISLGNTTQYPHKFIANYFVYAKPQDVINIEWIFPPSAAEIVTGYFADMSFELEKNVLHIYNENPYPTAEKIDKMFENGIWLARYIDAITNADINKEF